MTFVEMGHTGASKQSWRSPSPRALLKSLMDEAKDPHDGKVLFKDFLAAILPVAVRNAFENEDDEGRLIAVIEYWFTNNHNRMLSYFPKPGAKERKANHAAKLEEKQQIIRSAVRTHIKQEAKLLLLDWIMPNGKPIGDCTGQECRQFGRKVGPWFANIVSKVKPSELVRDVFDETQLRKLWGK